VRTVKRSTASAEKDNVLRVAELRRSLPWPVTVEMGIMELQARCNQCGQGCSQSGDRTARLREGLCFAEALCRVLQSFVPERDSIPLSKAG
jgi:hypothetical protein